MPDIGASVLARLKIKAKEAGRPVSLYLQLFCQEEFLRRVWMSQYADNLVLKGGMFIYTLTNFESRPTVDVDFLLRQLPNDVQAIQKIVDEILAVDTGNDYIRLTSKDFEAISPQRKYNGISFQLIGQIKNTRTPFSVDLGVGDIIIPHAEQRSIPLQLPGFTTPVIKTYSLESTIAEKYDAMLQWLGLTSRMKDFYDIYYLSTMFNFNGARLKQAVYSTLVTRATTYTSESLDQVIALGQDEDIQKSWRLYLHRAKLPEIPFDVVIKQIDTFLRPVWQAVINQEELQAQWQAQHNRWE